MMEMVLSKPTFAGTIPEASPHVPDSSSKGTAQPACERERGKLQSNLRGVSLLQESLSGLLGNGDGRDLRWGYPKRGAGVPCHSLEFLDSTVSLFYTDRGRLET